MFISLSTEKVREHHLAGGLTECLRSWQMVNDLTGSLVTDCMFGCVAGCCFHSLFGWGIFYMAAWLPGCLNGPPSVSMRTVPQNTQTQTLSRTHLTFFLLYYFLCIHQLPRVLLLMSAPGRCCSRYIHSLYHTHLLLHQCQCFPCSCFLQ